MQRPGCFFVLIDDAYVHQQGSLLRTTIGKIDGEGVCFIDRIPVRKDGKVDRLGGGIRKEYTFGRASSANCAGQIKIEACAIGRQRRRSGKSGIGRGGDEYLYQRIGDMPLPIHKNNLAVVQSPAKNVLNP